MERAPAWSSQVAVLSVSVAAAVGGAWRGGAGRLELAPSLWESSWFSLHTLVSAGSYYLTTTYGALEHIKNYDKITVTRQLSVEVQDSIHRWERRRTLNKARASRSSVQVTPGTEDGRRPCPRYHPNDCWTRSLIPAGCSGWPASACQCAPSPVPASREKT